MTQYSRYAVYFMPHQGDPLHEFGRNWFGYDPVTGESLTPTPLPGWPLEKHEALIAAPKKYGLHATLKAPFRLADGVTESDLLHAVDDFAARRDPVDPTPLALKRIGSFLALCPTVDQGPINALAAACVTELDPLRAPLTEAEIARRNPDKLSPRQRELLTQWGYPYVLDAFRFHVTVTGAIQSSEEAEALRSALERRISKGVERVDFAVSIVGESTENQRFREVSRFRFSQ